MLIRPATSDDAPAIWSIVGPTIRAGETYALPRDMSEADALSYWMGSDRQTFVAVADGRIVGTYYLRPNQAGGGDHVANCGYITDPAVAGQGVARRMAEHSIELARSRCAAFAPCNSTSWSAPTSVRFARGNLSALKSWADCRLPFATPHRVTWTRWSCSGPCERRRLSRLLP